MGTIALSLARFSHWWPYKMPPLLSVAYALLLINTVAFEKSPVLLAGILFSLVSGFIFGYLVNDTVDIMEDQAKGKANVIGNWPKPAQYLLIFIFFGSGFVPIVFLGFGMLAAGTFLCNYLVAAAYSFRPIRLKERGIWGVISDALAVHTLPTLFIGFALFSTVTELHPASKPWLLIATIWSFIFGLRGILIHQLNDRESDLLAGTKTFVANRDEKNVEWFVLRILIPAEIVLLGILLGKLYAFWNTLIIALPVYILFEIGRYSVHINKNAERDEINKNMYVPMGDFYEVWLALIIISGLSAYDANYVLLLAAHVILFLGRIKNHIQFMAQGMGGILKRLFIL